MNRATPMLAEPTVLTETYAQGPTSAAAHLAGLRARIFEFDAMDEQAAMSRLIAEARLDERQVATTQALATRLAEGVRKARLDAGSIDLLTQEFSLESEEGIALMCLAEAMLRIPDTETRNKLIRDKVVDQDWRSHIGSSPSLFVNATAWGLALTGKVLKPPSEQSLASALSAVLRRGGEHVVRAGVAFAMKLLGKQFVTGQTIEEALAVARGREKLGYRYSYDMLGEAALTRQDADGYYEAYAHTIEMVGRTSGGQGPIEGPGVSVKLTGLHPRYEVAQHGRVIEEMYPKLLALAQSAKKWNVGFHLDQEEAARFPLTIEMLDRLAHEPSLAGWEGLGISLQAYQKRGRAVVDWLVALARATRRRILVRLVKGAYWDTEIKRCQAEGADGFPVFTRKVHSDVSYLACAKALLAAPDAVFPQFATHNAFSIAAVHTLGEGKDYEFQCLHGMGETVYDQVVGASKLKRACRVYAPVGPHATLLAYLVRRLIENGANTSFVNQVVDTSVSIAQIVEDPVAKAAATGGAPNPAVVMPRSLLPWRLGAPAAGSNDHEPMAEEAGAPGSAADLREDDARLAAEAAVSAAAKSGSIEWARRPAADRARLLLAVAERLESGDDLLPRAMRAERVLTCAEAADELRRAADLCRLHAAQVQADGSLAAARPLGVVVVIAPASSPVAWTMGHVAAALVTGNAVVFKPASTCRRTGAALVALLHECGVPASALQLVPGPGRVTGDALVTHPQTSAVMVGGSRRVVAEIAKKAAQTSPHRTVFGRAAGCGAMVVDSSALPEQVISDAGQAMLDGAGMRCGSLKLLCLQDVVADKILDMLRAMLGERTIGDPEDIATDVGPLPSAAKRDAFERYLTRMSDLGYPVARVGRRASGVAREHHVLPAIVDMGSRDALRHLDPDVQGPVLHVIRWTSSALPELLADIDRHLGPSTLGLQTRIFETAGEVLSLSDAPNVYVNRAQHSARPGLQIDGASGADFGVSAVGPFFLYELVRGARPTLPLERGPFRQDERARIRQYLCYPVQTEAGLRDRRATEQRDREDREAMLWRLVKSAPTEDVRVHGHKVLGELVPVVRGSGPKALPALTGEENTFVIRPGAPVLCMGPSVHAVLGQVLTAVACGNTVLLPRTADNQRYADALGATCRLVELSRLFSKQGSGQPCAVLTEASGTQLQDLSASVAGGFEGDHVPVVRPEPDGLYPWWRFIRERQVTINASASGDNTQLMAEDEAGA